MTEVKLRKIESGLLRYLNEHQCLQTYKNIVEVLYPCDCFNNSAIIKLNSILNIVINKTVNTRILINNSEYYEMEL